MSPWKLFFVFCAEHWYLAISWEKSAIHAYDVCSDNKCVKEDVLVIMSDQQREKNSDFLDIKSQGCCFLLGRVVSAENTKLKYKQSTKDITKAIKLPVMMALIASQSYFEFLWADGQHNFRSFPSFSLTIWTSQSLIHISEHVPRLCLLNDDKKTAMNSHQA